MAGWRRVRLVAVLGIGFSGVTGIATVTAGNPAPVFRANDFGGGRLGYVDPPGEDGLVNAAELAQAQAPGGRPPAHSRDQTPLYADLLYGFRGLRDSQLARYFRDESFGIPPGQVTRTERPDPAQAVTIYRDAADVPHVYGETRGAMAFGAGYAAAEDRLFEMDVLRHTGAGHLSEFIGPSCSDEQMDHDQLLFAGYTQAQKQAQFERAAQLGPLGAEAATMTEAYVAGVNRYIDEATANPDLMPADYAVVGQLPTHWVPADLVDLAGLLANGFGAGGGAEVANAALLKYLQSQLGAAAGRAAFDDFKDSNDAGRPNTIVDAAFPYNRPGVVNPALTAIPDDPRAPLQGTPDATSGGCDPLDNLPPGVNPLAVVAPRRAGGWRAVAARVRGWFRHPAKESNALVVNASLSADGHPIAVFGPQVGYFTPEVLMVEDLHAPDYDAMGASFPGTNFIVELGRGRDFAWSATSSSTDIIDQRLEEVCDPAGGAPAATGEGYLFNGRCVPMACHDDNETAVSKPGGQGLPGVVLLRHHLCQTAHGVVQGWTAAGGRPVAVVNQRSTWQRDAENVLGFLRWNRPSYTHDVASWMEGARLMGNSFNWFYIDDRDTAVYSSARSPVRRPDVDPDLPTWGTGVAEWLSDSGPDAIHPQVINPAHGYLLNWNNSPAVGFRSADNDYTWQPVDRSVDLNLKLRAAIARTGGKLTRADVVSAMEAGAVPDSTATGLLPRLLPYMRASPSGTVRAMGLQLGAWLAAGAERIKHNPGDAEYAYPAAVASMDELYPRVVRALFDRVFLPAGPVTTWDGLDTGYPVLPQEWASTPNGDGAQQGDGYGGGWEGYVQKALDQLGGGHPPTPLSEALMAHLCGAPGPATCPAALERAFEAAAAALTSANGTADVATWTQDTQTRTAKTTLPDYDSISFTAVGIVGQPNIDYQNRPTFQQVAEFPTHAPRAGGTASSPSPPGLPDTSVPVRGAGLQGLVPVLLACAGAGLGLLLARTPRRGRG
jgi:acyl-homoserine lactone acylase PvdQ